MVKFEVVLDICGVNFRCGLQVFSPCTPLSGFNQDKVPHTRTCCFFIMSTTSCRPRLWDSPRCWPSPPCFSSRVAMLCRVTVVMGPDNRVLWMKKWLSCCINSVFRSTLCKYDWDRNKWICIIEKWDLIDVWINILISLINCAALLL